MDSVYTTTITQAAQNRGIGVDVLDPVLPVFALHYNNRTVRCYNGLTDFTGGASFHLTQDKGAANRFLKKHGFHVPSQEVYTNVKEALLFLEQNERIVVKPVSQWGGRGVSTHVSGKAELLAAIAFAKKYSDEILLEECVHGTDWRMIFVNYEFVTAIQRTPAKIIGNGVDSIKRLIQKKNALAKKKDPSNIVPFNKETERTIAAIGLTYETIPGDGAHVFVRRTTNYHTGGTVDIIGSAVGSDLIDTGKFIAKLTGIPVLGVDVLANDNGHHHIIELSPDLAISPPEGYIVVEKFLDFLFPETKNNSRVAANTENVDAKIKSANKILSYQSTLL